MEVPPGRLAATGGHLPARVDDGDPRYDKPVPRFCDQPDPDAGDGRATAPRPALRWKPKQHTQPLCTGSSVPSAAPSCGVWQTPQGSNHREPKPGTHPNEHARRHHRDRRALPNTAHACPAHHGRSSAVEGHHTNWRTLQEPEGHCERYAMTHRRAHATGAPQPPTADEETTRHPWYRLTSPETPTIGVKPAAKGPAISRDDPWQAELAQKSSPHNPTTHDRATHSANACRSDAPARVPPDYPTSAPGTQRCRPVLAALQPELSSTKTNPTTPPNPNEFLPRILGEGHALRAPAFHQRQGKGRAP